VQAPRRFDASLEALERDGVVSPREVRVRDFGRFPRGDAEVVREGCSSGALSARECGASDGGVRFSTRSDGGGGSIGTGFGGGGGGSGERYGIDAAPLPPIAVPGGTYTGWNLYAAPGLEGELCDREGSFLPFAATEAERAGDPRPSLAARYASAAARRTEQKGA
jgi:hypothetical protein